jgi:hypothetical protein
VSAPLSAPLDPCEQLRLLARHEPILAFTAGELFFPVRADRYIETSSLWCHRAGQDPELVLGAGDLDVEALVVEANREPHRPLQLRFVEQPLRGRDYRRWRARGDRPRLESRGRFTKVGLLARFIDALFRVGLLLRGRIPGGFAAAAEQRAAEVFGDEAPAYHGRVVLDGGYVALQYWYFYVMNDWRSTFAGVNDHEADWELVTVYLAHQDGELVPCWVGFSSHDERGADLRRRWDDPELEREGDHPVVYVGAGSHSSTVMPGDYVVAVDPPVVRPLLAGLSRVLTTVVPWSGPARVGLRIPYVDYHRGDGRRVGPGQGEGWQRCLVDDQTPWVRHFRGLWGLDTGDRFGGERAPAGPRFERDGRVRRSWADPLGWVALHGEPPSPHEARRLLEARIEEIDLLVTDLDDDIEADRAALRRRRLVERAGRVRGGEDRARLAGAERAVAALVEQRAGLLEERRLVSARLERGLVAEDPHAHLKHRRVPYATERSERDRFLRVWATVSSPLMVLALVVVLLRPPTGMLTALAVLLFVFFAIEALARRRALAYLGGVAVVAGGLVISGAVAVAAVQNWRIALSVVLGLAAAGLLALNISDLRRR